MPYDIDGEVPAHMVRDENVCEHGTYIGGCGIDHICGWCESGVSQAERVEIEQAELIRSAAKRRDEFDRFVGLMQSLHWAHGLDFGRCAAALADMADEPYWARGRHGLEVAA